jgi:predicted phosphodiesterase
MTTGVITDIHGNSVALDAVLADAASIGVESWFVLGDLVAVGPDPVGVFERLHSLPDATFVRGNTERYLGTDVGKHGLAWTRDRLGTSRVDWLASLPLHARRGSTLLVHASPGRDDGPGLDARLSDEQLHVLLRGCDATTVLVGHTHRRIDRTVEGVRALNPGSVGNPIEDDVRAGWAVIDGGDIQVRRVDYDVDAVIHQVVDSDNPVADAIVAHLRGERNFTNQPLSIDIDVYEPPLEAKRA